MRALGPLVPRVHEHQTPTRRLMCEGVLTHALEPSLVQSRAGTYVDVSQRAAARRIVPTRHDGAEQRVSVLVRLNFVVDYVLIGVCRALVSRIQQREGIRHLTGVCP